MPWPRSCAAGRCFTQPSWPRQEADSAPGRAGTSGPPPWPEGKRPRDPEGRKSDLGGLRRLMGAAGRVMTPLSGGLEPDDMKVIRLAEADSNGSRNLEGFLVEWSYAAAEKLLARPEVRRAIHAVAEKLLLEERVCGTCIAHVVARHVEQVYRRHCAKAGPWPGPSLPQTVRCT